MEIFFWTKNIIFIFGIIFQLCQQQKIKRNSGYIQNLGIILAILYITIIPHIGVHQFLHLGDFEKTFLRWGPISNAPGVRQIPGKRVHFEWVQALGWCRLRWSRRGALLQSKQPHRYREARETFWILGGPDNQRTHWTWMKFRRLLPVIYGSLSVFIVALSEKKL